MSPARENGADLPIQSEELMTRRQVGAVLGRSEATITRWIKKGILRPERLGPAVYFRSAYLRELLGLEMDRKLGGGKPHLDVASFESNGLDHETDVASILNVLDDDSDSIAS